MAQGNRAALGIYVGLSRAQLETMQAVALETIRKIMVAHQAYGRPGFNINRVELDQAKDHLAEINYALGLANGTAGPSRVVPDFSRVDPV